MYRGDSSVRTMIQTETFISPSVKQTWQFAHRLIAQLKDGEVLALTGDLGSGKTTFVQGLAQALNIKERILSPTFILMREYKIKVKSQKSKVKSLIHMDLYRVEDFGQVKDLGLEELWCDPQNLVVIEWAEKIKNHLPKNTIWIKFEYVDENSRRIEIR